MEYASHTDYTPETAWYNQVDVPASYHELTPEERSQHLARLSAFTLESAAQAETEQRELLLSSLGGRALHGIEHVGYRAGVGAEDVVRTIIWNK
jgi:hypothetical protein